jgi:hypothetical protein
MLPENWYGGRPCNALYAARFGVPAVGKRVFIRTVQQINGWQDHPQTFSARVPPG